MTEGAAIGPFAPLREDDAPSSAAPPPPDAWVPQLPAPEEPPEASDIRHRQHGAATARWIYRDAEGRPLFAVVRFDPKDPDGTPKQRPDGKPAKEVLPYTCGTKRGRPDWQFKAAPKPRPLYGLDQLKARPDAPVVMVEGEKAADAAAALFPEHVAMTWQGGSNAIGKADCSPLAGRSVVVWGDNDAPGRKAAGAVVKALAGIAAGAVPVVPVPLDWPDGWDVADPLPEGVEPSTLNEMLDLAAAEAFGDGDPGMSEEPTEGTENARCDRAAEDEEIKRLAALDPLDYDRERQPAADRLGIRVSTLDHLVEEAKPKSGAAHGRFVGLAEVEPWPSAVTGAELLADLATAVRRHVIVSASAADCIAAWIAHTWVADRFQHTPRLSVTSPAKRCGKSTLLDVLRATCRRAIKADNISASGVFRTVETLSPITLLVDEADTFLGDNEQLRGILNSGFERSGEVIRVIEVKGEWRPTRFATFCPVALAGIGALPGTLEDRAMPVVLQRKAATEVVVKLRASGARAALADLARRCARWAEDWGRRLTVDPAIPDALGDREGDIAVPLLAIADNAAGEWPARIRRALLTVFGHRAATESNADHGSLLLADLRTLFVGTSSVRMTSAEIIQMLTALEERPWPEWRHGKPITAPQLARALAPFGVRPGTIRRGNVTAKGYYKDAFTEAWGRYLPPSPSPDSPSFPPKGGPEPSHRHSPGNSRSAGDNEAVTTGERVTERTNGKAAETLAGDGVTAKNLAYGGEGVEETGAGGWSTTV